METMPTMESGLYKSCRLSTAQRRRVEADGWTYCGSWMGTLHYFKRSGEIGA